MLRLVAVALSLAAVGCNRETIEVDRTAKDDYNHAALVTAVDKFVKANRTPEAYAELAQTVSRLRPQMDRTVAREAELRLIVLALGPAQAMQGKSIGERVRALATTVWPTLLAPPVEADTMLVVRDPNAPKLVPKPGEEPQEYLVRICGDVLARYCKRVVPEYQGEVVEALAFRRATERARNAVSECLACDNDPGWRQAVHTWENLDRTANDRVVETERRADPDNWPVAGSAAEDDPELPEAQLSTRGELIVGGRAFGPNQQRIEVLRELRGDSEMIQLHLHPDTTLAQARGVLVDVRRSGAKRVAVIAREPFYPYRRKAYWVADGYGMRANLRPTDSLQLLIHAIDEVAGPGTVARVD